MQCWLRSKSSNIQKIIDCHENGTLLLDHTHQSPMDTLLPGELCCCQENDLQRDGKNAEVLFYLHKQPTSELFFLPSDKVSVQRDRDEPASIDHLCRRRGNPWSPTQRQLWGWCWQTPAASKWVWEFLSTPSAWKELCHRKLQFGRCMLGVSSLVTLDRNVWKIPSPQKKYCKRKLF